VLLQIKEHYHEQKQAGKLAAAATRAAAKTATRGRKKKEKLAEEDTAKGSQQPKHKRKEGADKAKAPAEKVVGKRGRKKKEVNGATSATDPTAPPRKVGRPPKKAPLNSPPHALVAAENGKQVDHEDGEDEEGASSSSMPTIIALAQTSHKGNTSTESSNFLVEVGIHTEEDHTNNFVASLLNLHDGTQKE